MAGCPCSGRDYITCPCDSSFYGTFPLDRLHTIFDITIIINFNLIANIIIVENSENGKKNQEENKHRLQSHHPEITTVNILVDFTLIKVTFKRPGKFYIK